MSRYQTDKRGCGQCVLGKENSLSQSLDGKGASGLVESVEGRGGREGQILRAENVKVSKEWIITGLSDLGKALDPCLCHCHQRA